MLARVVRPGRPRRLSPRGERQAPERSGTRRTTISTKVFVGNLDFHTTPDDLAGLLSQAGQITDVHMPSDRLTGRPRGFAFVEFSSSEEAAAAIERFHGHELDGRELRLDRAEERPQNSGGPRSFRSGGPGGGGGGANRGGRGGYQDRKKKKGGSRRGLRGRKRSL